MWGDGAMTWRERRLLQIADRVNRGDYDVPPIEVAHAILFGRPRWGDNPRMVDREQEQAQLGIRIDVAGAR